MSDALTLPEDITRCQPKDEHSKKPRNKKRGPSWPRHSVARKLAHSFFAATFLLSQESGGVHSPLLVQHPNMVLAVFELCAFELFFEAGEFLSPLCNAADIAKPRIVFGSETFPRHHDGNTRRVRYHPYRRDSARQFVERQMFTAPCHVVLKGGTRQFHRCRDVAKGIGLEFIHLTGFHVGKHFVAQVLQSRSGVANR